MGPWKISPRRHTRDLTALAQSWPRYSLPTAEPGAWGQDGAVGKSGESSAAVLPVGSGDSELRGAHASHRPPLPAPARSRRALQTRALAGREGPGCPLQTAGHIRRPLLLSTVVTEAQLLALRKRPESVTRGSKGRFPLQKWRRRHQASSQVSGIFQLNSCRI